MTKKQFEVYLNELYSYAYTLEGVKYLLGYLGTEKTIERNYDNVKLGTLLRKKDPLAFDVNYKEKNSKI